MTDRQTIEQLIERIPLSGGKEALVDAADLALVAGRKWSASKSKNGNYYVVRGSGASRESMHRLIIGAKKGELVDHINGNGLDNRRINLRITNHFGNAQNRRAKPGAHGYRGVHKHPEARTKPFYAQISIRGRAKNFGFFATAEEAAHEYDRLAIIHHGEFAVLNFPGGVDECA